MKYNVTVKPGTSQEKVEVVGGDGGGAGNAGEGSELTVWVRAKAHDGEANAAVVKVLAKYFGVAKGRVAVVRGAKGRKKVVEIL